MRDTRTHNTKIPPLLNTYLFLRPSLFQEKKLQQPITVQSLCESSNLQHLASQVAGHKDLLLCVREGSHLPRSREVCCFCGEKQRLLVVRGWVQCIHSPTHKQACELYMPACALVCQGRSTFPSVLSFLAPSVLRPKTLLFMQKELLPSFIYFYMSRVFVSIREYVRICECMCK